MPHPCKTLVLLACLTFGPISAMAADGAAITTDTYEVTGKSLAQVEAKLTSKGPHGFWAYTTWNVAWTGDCVLTVTAHMILPKLAGNAGLTDAQMAEFDRMRAALKAHEMQHVDFALGYAKDLADAGCPDNAHDMVEPWLEKERQFDIDTSHGLTQGVFLKEP